MKPATGGAVRRGTRVSTAARAALACVAALLAMTVPDTTRAATAPAQDVAPATPLAADERGTSPDEDAARLLERLAARTADVSFAAAADLTVRRPGHERSVRVRVYRHAGLDRWLLRVDGRVRESGTRVLLADDRVLVRFPRVDTLLELPVALGGERLLGSDFGVGDLAVLADGGRRFTARVLDRSEEDRTRLVRLELVPRESRSSLYGAVRLTLDEQLVTPRELEFLDELGAIVRRVLFHGDGPLPDRWTATTPGRDGWESTLEVTYFDPAPRFHDEAFTAEELRR